MNLHNPFAFADISRIEPALKKVLLLDPNFYYAGAHRGLGVFYGSRTKILGGNPEQAKANFEKSLSLTKRRFLINSFLYAKTYAVQSQDSDLFKKLLNEILEAPDDLFPEERLANAVAKLKAKALLESIDDLF
jgi:tetratricopeptide (TPR) repeat protein